MTETTSLVGLSPDELKTALIAAGVPEKSAAMRTRQLWNWMYVHGARDFAAMTNLAKDFRAQMAGRLSLARPEIVTEQISSDGTRKWLLRSGGQEFETVFIPEPGRGTLCVSSQVGCTLNCRFCHTGTQKLVRNLTPAEIVGQVLVARDSLGDWPSTGENRRVTNVVMMGMGEPLYNFENVKAALAIVADGDALALSRRRVTLSTAGVVPMIKRAGEEIGSALAISLHAVRDEIRDVIVPLNKKYPLKELLDACRNYPGVSNARRITFEYVMLKGVNDSLADARQLVKVIAGIPAKINLIPFNPWPGAPYECSEWGQIEKFAEIVNRAGYASPVRTPRGRDIMAACGQLKSESIKQRASERMAQMRSAELARMPS
ncbi:MAG: 23S rRNA (adenine(2503)-C(2))-methyltransferase RlmN [Alphaproteobacteria bacterium]|nr:23S rRNA (adenine(2503)-C(2))-methyltransferase RlmN [Alphaproteobacteria bacterium]MDE1987560.1 23S rRNA (adenine(2503)-C(2))-methyltransferase RlmN [Alphaproteobacteria bacterium]MDE2162144.1 23S rRNA (adenine(2503)-C(2))-methyltransferase RlmN [Alphaproteobacteria bacterium]MDE2266932.1 23S rRNA (adenine(2503)-C(2))-methyltransferase RlmN [Alphaproteobacteria bacterium]